MPNSFQRPAPSGRLIPTPREMVAACFGSSFASAVLAIGSEHWLDAGMGGYWHRDLHNPFRCDPPPLKWSDLNYVF